MLYDNFGRDIVESTYKNLESKFKRDIENLRQYFTLLDVHIAELYHVKHNSTNDF